jgi:hypothetical protein
MIPTHQFSDSRFRDSLLRFWRDHGKGRSQAYLTYAYHFVHGYVKMDLIFHYFKNSIMYPPIINLNFSKNLNQSKLRPMNTQHTKPKVTEKKTSEKTDMKRKNTDPVEPKKKTKTQEKPEITNDTTQTSTVTNVVSKTSQIVPPSTNTQQKPKETNVTKVVSKTSVTSLVAPPSTTQEKPKKTNVTKDDSKATQLVAPPPPTRPPTTEKVVENVQKEPPNKTSAPPSTSLRGMGTTGPIHNDLQRSQDFAGYYTHYTAKEQGYNEIINLLKDHGQSLDAQGVIDKKKQVALHNKIVENVGRAKNYQDNELNVTFFGGTGHGKSAIINSLLDEKKTLSFQPVLSKEQESSNAGKGVTLFPVTLKYCKGDRMQTITIEYVSKVQYEDRCRVMQVSPLKVELREIAKWNKGFNEIYAFDPTSTKSGSKELISNPEFPFAKKYKSVMEEYNSVISEDLTKRTMLHVKRIILKYPWPTGDRHLSFTDLPGFRDYSGSKNIDANLYRQLLITSLLPEQDIICLCNENLRGSSSPGVYADLIRCDAFIEKIPRLISMVHLGGYQENPSTKQAREARESVKSSHILDPIAKCISVVLGVKVQDMKYTDQDISDEFDDISNAFHEGRDVLIPDPIKIHHYVSKTVKVVDSRFSDEFARILKESVDERRKEAASKIVQDLHSTFWLIHDKLNVYSQSMTVMSIDGGNMPLAEKQYHYCIKSIKKTKSLSKYNGNVKDFVKNLTELSKSRSYVDLTTRSVWVSYWNKYLDDVTLNLFNKLKGIITKCLENPPKPLQKDKKWEKIKMLPEEKELAMTALQERLETRRKAIEHYVKTIRDTFGEATSFRRGYKKWCELPENDTNLAFRTGDMINDSLVNLRDILKRSYNLFTIRNPRQIEKDDNQYIDLCTRLDALKNEYKNEVGQLYEQQRKLYMLAPRHWWDTESYPKQNNSSYIKKLVKVNGKESWVTSGNGNSLQYPKVLPDGNEKIEVFGDILKAKSHRIMTDDLFADYAAYTKHEPTSILPEVIILDKSTRPHVKVQRIRKGRDTKELKFHVPTTVDEMLKNYYMKPSGTDTVVTQILDPILIASTPRCSDGKFKPNFFLKELSAVEKSDNYRLKSKVFVFLEESQRHHEWFEEIFAPPSELKDYVDRNVIKVFLPDNLGMGRIVNIMKHLMMHYNIPYDYMMDDDIAVVEEYINQIR